MMDECFSKLLLACFFPSVLQAASHAGAAAQEKFPNLVIYLLQVAALSQSLGRSGASRDSARRGRAAATGMNSTLYKRSGGGVLAYYCARAMTSAAGASMSSIQACTGLYQAGGLIRAVRTRRTS